MANLGNFIFYSLLLTTSISNHSFANNFSLESPAFAANTTIPSQYTCDGANNSPPLKWQDAAANTHSYVLLVDDPDAPGGNWVHWVLFNIPGNLRELSEAAATPSGAVSGKNSWGTIGYRGPCPPSGTHRYIFKLYALDTLLKLDESATEQDVILAMQNHIIANTELIGLYR